MEAFKAALRNDADMIEIDIRLTLIHDDKVDRTTDGSGSIRDKTYEELRKLNAGGSDNYLVIPTLEEFFELIEDKYVMLNLEIKEYYSEDNKQRYHYCIDETIKLVEKYNFSDRIVFNSFDAYVLEYIYERCV